MNRFAVVVVTLLVLTACGTMPEWVKRSLELAEQGQCDESVREVESGSSSSTAKGVEEKAMLLGAIYIHCGNRELGIRWATLGARYGNGPSINLLTNMGAPVPQADLKNRSQNISVGEAMLLLGATQSMQPQSPPPLPHQSTTTSCWRNGSMVNCTTN